MNIFEEERYVVRKNTKIKIASEILDLIDYELCMYKQDALKLTNQEKEVKLARIKGMKDVVEFILYDRVVPDIQKGENYETNYDDPAH